MLIGSCITSSTCTACDVSISRRIDFAESYKNNPAPDYPQLAVRQSWQGTVLLRVRVLATGAVESVEVLKSSGKKVLDDAAIHTVERWVFAPSTRGNTPVDGFATVPIEFKLDS